MPHKWPLGLDILKLQYDAIPDMRFLRFQTQYFEKFGPTMAVKVLGNVGYATTDPKNVESMLTTNFEGLIVLSCSMFRFLIQLFY